MTKIKTISDYKVGDSATIVKKVNKSDIERFAAMSGDMSAIHVDDKAAKILGFKGKVAHGLLIGSWISALIGNDLPGDFSIMQNFKLDFRAPLVPPDTIEISGRVQRISKGVGQLHIMIEVRSSDTNKILATGEVRSIIPSNPLFYEHLSKTKETY